jgi:uncharacterized protein YecT (DUF1311 family)
MTRRQSFLILGGAIVVRPGLAPSSVQTQGEMNAEAARDLRVAETEMAALLSSLASKANRHADARTKLNRAQAAWVAYRDAHIESLWPSKTPQSTYGSVHPMCRAMERTKLTAQRIAELRLMLKAEEGEVCFGAWPE